MKKIDTKLSDQISGVLCSLGFERVGRYSTITLKVNTGTLPDTKELRLKFMRDISDPIGYWGVETP